MEKCPLTYPSKRSVRMEQNPFEKIILNFDTEHVFGYTKYSVQLRLVVGH